MLSHLREIVFGPPLPTGRMETERLNKTRALAALSPGALSSVAYANQEIYLGLVVAGAVGLAYSWPIALAITVLLVIVAASYSQTLEPYPNGGGSYAVAKENFGPGVGLLAAGALLIDYVLTSAVSLTAGVAEIASAFPALTAYRVPLALAILLFILLANLRGLRESGTAMTIPVYLFLISFGLMLVAGLATAIRQGPGSWAAAPAPSQTLTPLLIVHAFATGCTALTGIEAISNGITMFRPPVARNATRTLWVMAGLMAALFLGSVGLSQYLAVLPQSGETVLSALARQVLGTSFAYYLVQVGTLLILAVAANTSFAGFPRLASVLAADRYLPHQFANLGDRLVYSNGMIVLATLTALLILVFGGDAHALIPLFAVGVFLAFTLSQAGMLRHWHRVRSPGWQWKTAVNGVGAVVTAVTFSLVAFSKFVDGAWIVLVLMPGLAILFRMVHAHYGEVSRELTLHGLPPDLRRAPKPRVVIPISGVHRGIIDAVRYAQSIADDVRAVYVEIHPGQAEVVLLQWRDWWPDIPLDVIPSPYRSLVGPLLGYLDQIDELHNDGQQATVLLPEFIPAHWWQALLHNQTAWLLKTAMLYRRRRRGYQRAIIDVPYHLKR